MKRRLFIKKTMAALSAPIILNGIPMNLMAASLTKMMASSPNDRVVVMIQLSGGNDGLNMIIPIGQYDSYVDYRENIAIPDSGDRKYIVLDENMPEEEKLGLHPDMIGLKAMYDEQMAHIVQNVGYEDMNMSHFRGRDIFFMGGGVNDYYASGWMGRYLNETYPGYPDDYPNDEMLDPLGIEFGYAQSFAFQREEGIPAGLAIYDPNAFYDLVSGTGVEPPTWLPDTYAGEELQYLMELELKSNQYAERIKFTYDNGINSSSVSYPDVYPYDVPDNYRDNPLSWQLKNVARLISGGSKTKLFIVKVERFDTHVEQTLENDTTMGIHASLLYNVNMAVKAFYDDLSEQGLADKVFSFTLSEFGRRVNSNDSRGTDHGKAAPMLLFGPMLKPGVSGHAPDLSDLDDGNLRVEFDYRQVLTSVLKDWLETPDDVIEEVFWSDFIDSRLDLFLSPNYVQDIAKSKGLNEIDIYPNPAHTFTTLSLNLDRSLEFEILLFNTSGSMLNRVYHGTKAAGAHEFVVDVSSLPKGMYLLQVQNNSFSISRKLIVK